VITCERWMDGKHQRICICVCVFVCLFVFFLLKKSKLVESCSFQLLVGKLKDFLPFYKTRSLQQHDCFILMRGPK
jgi:hypothetical protein